MGWMILLMKEKDLGEGCASCRFLETLKKEAECLADERVCVYRKGEINEYRPYSCPFRYYTDQVFPIAKRFNMMTEEETAGWFKGADFQARHYARLEEERDRYVQSKTYQKYTEDEYPDMTKVYNNCADGERKPEE